MVLSGLGKQSAQWTSPYGWLGSNDVTVFCDNCNTTGSYLELTYKIPLLGGLPPPPPKHPVSYDCVQIIGYILIHKNCK